MQRHAARYTTGNYYSMNPGCVTNMVTQLGWDLLEHRRAKHRMNPVIPGCVTNMVTQLGWDLLEHRRAKHRMNPVIPGCVTNMVTQLGYDLLEHRSAKHRITMSYEIINNLAIIPVHHQLKVYDSNTRGSASQKFRQLNKKLNCYKYSFLSATIASWYTLPLEVRQLPPLEQFQHALSQISVSSLVVDDMGFLSIIICQHVFSIGN